VGKLNVVTALVVILSFAAGLAEVAFAHSGTETRVTTSPVDQFNPSTSGSRIVYSDERALDVDI
jgi:beta propeller repeat protein